MVPSMFFPSAWGDRSSIAAAARLFIGVSLFFFFAGSVVGVNPMGTEVHLF